MAQCKATARRSGRQCQKRAVKGARVCLSHGAAAPQVKRAAAERAALQRAAELLGPDVRADPAEVLVAAVRSSAALLGAAEAAIRADEADTDALHALGEAAMLAGRLAKLALDAGLEARLARQAEQAGQAVASMVTAIVNGLELPPAVSAAAFRLVRREVEKQPTGLDLGRYAGLSVAELDVEIARVVADLDAADARDAVDGFPARMAGTLQAALGALDLSDDQRERALEAAEQHLSELAAERAERDRLRLERAAEVLGPGAWWVGGVHNGGHQRHGGPGGGLAYRGGHAPVSRTDPDRGGRPGPAAGVAPPSRAGFQPARPGGASFAWPAASAPLAAPDRPGRASGRGRRPASGPVQVLRLRRGSPAVSDAHGRVHPLRPHPRPAV